MTHPMDAIIDHALGLLEPHEIVPLEEHLKTCKTCRADFHRLRGTFALLPEELQPVAPPLGSWERIQSRLRPAPSPVVKFAPRRLWSRFAAAAVLTLVLSSLGLALWRSQVVLQDTTQALAVVNRWLARADVRFAPLLERDTQRSIGRVLVLPDGRALIVMPQSPPAGRSYQVWGLNERLPSAVAELLGVSSQSVFEVRTRAYSWFWVTLEPVRGSQSPTTSLGWSFVARP
jgi:anti-sigma-K factor RskA